jgi:hypothetical protein
MRNSVLEKSLSEGELKFLFELAYESYNFGWISDLHESLSDVVEENAKIWSALDDIKDLLEKEDIRLGSKSRQRIVLTLKRFIAFNNRSERERIRFNEVGLGDCLEEASVQLKSLTKVLRLMEHGSDS